MIAFEVSLNGERLTVAGAEDMGVLTVILSAVGKLGSATIDRIEREAEIEVSLSVGGLTSRADEDNNEFLDWVERTSLSTGDEFHLKVLELDKADRPVSSKPHNKTDNELKLFQYAKENYFRLRDKYEKNTDATS